MKFSDKKPAQIQGGCAGPGCAEFHVLLDDLEQKKDENYGEDEAQSASSVVTEAWSHAITTETEQQNQDDQKNDHCCCFLPYKSDELLC